MISHSTLVGTNLIIYRKPTSVVTNKLQTWIIVVCGGSRKAACEHFVLRCWIFDLQSAFPLRVHEAHETTHRIIIHFELRIH